MGIAFFLRTRSTPAINVVATAPMPTVRTPSFPFGKAMPADLRILISPVVFNISGTGGCDLHCTNAAFPFAQTTYHARTSQDLQTLQDDRTPLLARTRSNFHRPSEVDESGEPGDR